MALDQSLSLNPKKKAMANNSLLKSLPRELLDLFMWLPEVNIDSKSQKHTQKNCLLGGCLFLQLLQILMLKDSVPSSQFSNSYYHQQQRVNLILKTTGASCTNLSLPQTQTITLILFNLPGGVTLKGLQVLY